MASPLALCKIFPSPMSGGRRNCAGRNLLAPLGVGITEENLTGSAGWGVLLPSQLKALLGGSVAYDGGTGRTTYTKKVNEEPVPFHLHCITPADASGHEIMLFNCLAPTVQIMDVGDTRAFIMRNMDFRVYGKRLGADTEATLLSRSGRAT